MLRLDCQRGSTGKARLASPCGGRAQDGRGAVLFCGLKKIHLLKQRAACPPGGRYVAPTPLRLSINGVRQLSNRVIPDPLHATLTVAVGIRVRKACEDTRA